MPDGAYPLSLYRSGSSFEWDGRMTDSCVVGDEDEHLQAAEDGWQEASDYFAAPKTLDPERRRPGRPPKVRTDDNGTAELA